MFIVIEGPDKSGKTSTLAKLQKFFTEENLALYDVEFPKIVIFVKESIHDDTFGVDFRRLVVSRNAGNILRGIRADMSDKTQAYLWLSARIEMIHTLAKHLNENHDYKIDCRKDFSQLEEVMKSKDVLIIYDRFVASTIVYQGATQKMRDKIYKMHEDERIPKPDITFILEINEDEYMKRITNNERGKYQNFRYEEEQSRIFEVFDAYNLMAKGEIESYSDNVQSIDTDLYVSKEVADIIAGRIADYMESNYCGCLNVHNSETETDVENSDAEGEALATNSNDEEKMSTDVENSDAEGEALATNSNDEEKMSEAAYAKPIFQPRGQRLINEVPVEVAEVIVEPLPRALRLHLVLQGAKGVKR